ncbi:hypothetical protein YC2023_002622 [Brassica napus]
MEQTRHHNFKKYFIQKYLYYNQTKFGPERAVYIAICYGATSFIITNEVKCSRSIFQLNIAGKGEKPPTYLNKKKMLRDLQLFSVQPIRERDQRMDQPYDVLGPRQGTSDFHSLPSREAASVVSSVCDRKLRHMAQNQPSQATYMLCILPVTRAPISHFSILAS